MKFQDVCKSVLVLGVMLLFSHLLLASGKEEISSEEESVKDLAYFQKFYREAALKCKIEYEKYQSDVSEHKHTAKRQKKQHITTNATDQKILQVNYELLSVQAAEHALVSVSSALTLYEYFPLVSLCLGFFDKLQNTTGKATRYGKPVSFPAGFLLPFAFPEISKHPVPIYARRDISWLSLSSLEDFLTDVDEDTLPIEREQLVSVYKDALQDHFSDFFLQTGLTTEDIPQRMNVFLNLWCQRYSVLEIKLQEYHDDSLRLLSIGPLLQESKPEHGVSLSILLRGINGSAHELFKDILPASLFTEMPQDAWNTTITKNLCKVSESLLKCFSEAREELNLMDDFLEYVRQKELSYAELYKKMLHGWIEHD